jgi:hypothetical protein
MDLDRGHAPIAKDSRSTVSSMAWRRHSRNWARAYLRSTPPRHQSNHGQTQDMNNKSATTQQQQNHSSIPAEPERARRSQVVPGGARATGEGGHGTVGGRGQRMQTHTYSARRMPRPSNNCRRPPSSLSTATRGSRNPNVLYCMTKKCSPGCKQRPGWMRERWAGRIRTAFV